MGPSWVQCKGVTRKNKICPLMGHVHLSDPINMPLFQSRWFAQYSKLMLLFNGFFLLGRPFKPLNPVWAASSGVNKPLPHILLGMCWKPHLKYTIHVIRQNELVTSAAGSPLPCKKGEQHWLLFYFYCLLICIYEIFLPLVRCQNNLAGLGYNAPWMGHLLFCLKHWYVLGPDNIMSPIMVSWLGVLITFSLLPAPSLSYRRQAFPPFSQPPLLTLSDVTIDR